MRAAAALCPCCGPVILSPRICYAAALDTHAILTSIASKIQPAFPSPFSFLLNFIQDPPSGIKKGGLLSRDIPAYLTLVHQATSTGGEDCKVANLFLLVSVLPVILACELLALLLATASTISSTCVRMDQNNIFLHKIDFSSNRFHMATDGNPFPRTDGHFPKVMASNPLKAEVLWPPPEKSIDYVLRDPLKES